MLMLLMRDDYSNATLLLFCPERRQQILSQTFNVVPVV
jgi:hypothetical protein